MTKTAGSLILMVGYLGPGGAERQITYLARGMVQAGWDTSLLTFSLRDDGAHFADVLRAEHIPLHALDRADPLFRSQGLLLRLTMAAPMLNNLPVEIESEVVKAAALFLRKRPDLVICYLDRVNIVGGLAAVIAGVPRVLLSGRNLNPSHFPYLDRPWFQQFYRLLLASPGVTLMTNSHAGARSYEHWLGLPHASVPVIHNGLAETALPEAAPEQVASLRAELGLAHGSPLVLGVFRLSPEKRPLVFFDLVTRLRDEFPGLQAAIAGIGIDFEEMQAELRQSGRDRFIHLLGRRSDMPALFQAADLMLHVSAAEGVPNAVMEAQWLGCPVVGTLSGGTGEILTEPQRPYFHAIDDEEGLYRSCRGLLADTPLRQRLGQSSRAEARRRFCADTLVERTVDLARATAPFTLPSPRVRGFRPATILAFMRLWLRLARPVHHLRRWVRRRRYSAVVTDISAELGHCYLAPIPAQLTSDDCGTSALRLREDGRLLSPAHTLHTDIRSLGGGRYSHWGASLYFSTSDNSDPRDNGRVYTVEEADTHVDDTALV